MGLWTKVDSNGNIVEVSDKLMYTSITTLTTDVQNTVVKETYLDNIINVPWDSPLFWYRSLKDKLPREAMFHRIMPRPPQATSIVHQLASAVYRDRKTYRMYLEYCPHGDLEGVITDYQRREALTAEDGNVVNVRIPELTLWGIFESLVSAACLMQFGRLPGTTSNRSNHLDGEIVHRGIKPENIFLSPPHARLWPYLPMVKLGDSGYAVHAKDKFLRNPDNLRGTKTTQYMAPEQRVWTEESRKQYSNGRAEQVRSSSDIYAIGRIMMSLMNLSDLPRTTPSGFDQGLSTKTLPSEEARRFYTPMLTALVVDCCKATLGQRVKAEAARHRIRKHTIKFDVNDTESLPRRLQQLGSGEQGFYKGFEKCAAWAQRATVCPHNLSFRWEEWRRDPS